MLPVVSGGVTGGITGAGELFFEQEKIITHMAIRQQAAFIQCKDKQMQKVIG
jgi:hypothetical protein